jgi:murein L,D-transpeptidase YcbB/YkuD
VRHETIPKLQKNPGYAKKSHIEIHKGWSQHSPSVDPYKVDWKKYGKKLPPWHFMQSPGEKNALGKVKFLFPNPYSVYMHDSPEKALFGRDIRAFSHGCVRLHRPIDMLQTFTQIDPKIDFAHSEKILAKNVNTPMRLKRSVPIDIIYLSAWVDEEGVVQFREDIYGYDELQMETAKWFPKFKESSPKTKANTAK